MTIGEEFDRGAHHTGRSPPEVLKGDEIPAGGSSADLG